MGDFRDLTAAEWVAFMNGDDPLTTDLQAVIDVTIVKPTKLEKIDFKIAIKHKNPVAIYYRGLLARETTEERHGDYHWPDGGEVPVFEDDFGLLRDRNESDTVPCLVVVWSGNWIDRYHRVVGDWVPANGDIPWPPSMGCRLSVVRERLVKLYSEHGQLEINMDGSAWCAKFADFINLMESPCGFGDTPEEALGRFYVDVQKHALEGAPKPVNGGGHE